MGRLRKPGREKAALLLAEGHMPDRKIAESIGISNVTLQRWKHDPQFDARINEIAGELSAEALKYSIARREGRIAVQNDLQNRLMVVIKERAEQAERDGVDIPGMKTGLVCKTLKGIGKGNDFQVVEVYETDTPTVKAVIALHEQAAREMGQFEEAEIKVRANLADVIADARKRVAQSKLPATSSVNVTIPTKPSTTDRVN